MIERQRHSSLFGRRSGAAPPLDHSDVLTDRTVPGISLTGAITPDEPMILGFPAEDGPVDGERPETADTWTEQQPAAVETGPVPEVRLVTLPRADPAAALALVLAGVAAVASLWLPWRQDQGDTGWSLLRRGLALAGTSLQDFGRSGFWQPVAIVLGGVLLFLLGVVLFLPEGTHRIAGVLALLVASGPIAGVLFLVAREGWNSARFGPGMWLAIAVPTLGCLGALKAMLRTPRVTLRRRGSRPPVR
jgi:hypothetical protein